MFTRISSSHIGIRGATATTIALTTAAAAATGWSAFSSGRSTSVAAESSPAAASAATLPPPHVTRWKNQWSKGQTTWHKPYVHTYLQKYVDSHLLVPEHSPARVFVPLCGKTIDMKYLVTDKKEKVKHLVGADCAREAFENFAQEHPELKIMVPPPSTDTHASDDAESDEMEFFSGPSMTLIKGDFFKLNDTITGGKFEAIWDRAALHAVDPKLREAYVDVLGQVIAPGGRILLAAKERMSVRYKNAGPPFSMDEAEVRRLFQGKPWVESVEFLEARSATMDDPWFVKLKHYWSQGAVNENLYLIVAKK